MNLYLLFLPITSTLLGWIVITLTSSLIMKYLRQSRPTLITSLTTWAGDNLISKKTLVDKVQQVDIRSDVTALLNSRIDSVLDKFVEKTPMVAFFMNDALKGTIKNLVIEEIVSELPQWQQSLAEKTVERLDLPSWMQQSLQGLDWNTIEKQIENAMAEALKPVRWMAVGIGLGMGILQAVVVWVVVS